MPCGSTVFWLSWPEIQTCDIEKTQIWRIIFCSCHSIYEILWNLYFLLKNIFMTGYIKWNCLVISERLQSTVIGHNDHCEVVFLEVYLWTFGWFANAEVAAPSLFKLTLRRTDPKLPLSGLKQRQQVLLMSIKLYTKRVLYMYTYKQQ